MRAALSIIVITSCLLALPQRGSGQSIIPKHTINVGGIVTTMNAGAGAFIDYQYHIDEEISYAFKPGITGILQNTDSLNIIMHIGINYRLNTLRRPLKDKFLNFQPYAGFYPASLEYLIINSGDTEVDGTRLGWSPMGVLGYTIIFTNKISLDLHAGFGMSFRIGRSAGNELLPSSIINSGITPTAAAGVSLGIRL